MNIDKWAFTTAVDAAGVEHYEDYSGRGMYGDTCPGVTFSSSGDLADFYIELADITDSDTAKSLARSERQDSMGLNGIAYWPGLKLTDED